MRRALLLCLVVTGLAAAPAGAFTAADACDNLQSCQLQTGPWVVVPALNGTQYGEGNFFIQCPQLLLAADTSYNATGAVYSVTTAAEPAAPELAIFRFFVAFNGFSAAFSYQPGVGCTPYTFTSGQTVRRAGVPGGLVTRVSVVHPSSTLSFANRCTGGKRFLGDGAGVAFKTKRPPTRQEMREVRVVHTHGRKSGHIRVTVGPHVGDHESVVVQVQKRCA